MDVATGKSAVVSELQSLKAESPMDVTELELISVILLSISALISPPPPA